MLLIDGYKHVIFYYREAFRNSLNIEMDLYDAFTDYGKGKAI